MRALRAPRRHSPRRRGFQYAAASRFIADVSKYWIARLDVQTGEIADRCSGTWPTHYDGWMRRFWEAVHAVAGGVDDGAATGVCASCAAGRSEPAGVVPAVRDQSRYGLQMAAALAAGDRSGGSLAAAAWQPEAQRPALEARVLAVRDAHPAWGARKIARCWPRGDRPAGACRRCMRSCRRHGRIVPPAGGARGASALREARRPTCCGRWTSRAGCGWRDGRPLPSADGGRRSFALLPWA